MENKKILKVIDANINRLKEGLRVVEDIFRFYHKDTQLFRKIRNVRHRSTQVALDVWNFGSLVSSRSTKNDDGRKKDSLEVKRADLRAILSANLQRSKESLRVLEEFAKLKSPNKSFAFKKMRFVLYETEKKIFKKY